MKYLLVFLLIVSDHCYGQQYPICQTLPSRDTLISNLGIRSIITPKQDTVKVLMLVCDTTADKTILTWNRLSEKFEPYDYFVWWEFGYEVRFTNEYDFMNYVEYLDQNKKRLPLNLVVWVSKGIK